MIHYETFSETYVIYPVNLEFRLDVSHVYDIFTIDYGSRLIKFLIEMSTAIKSTYLLVRKSLNCNRGCGVFLVAKLVPKFQQK